MRLIFTLMLLFSFVFADEGLTAECSDMKGDIQRYQDKSLNITDPSRKEMYLKIASKYKESFDKYCSKTKLRRISGSTPSIKKSLYRQTNESEGDLNGLESN